MRLDPSRRRRAEAPAQRCPEARPRSIRRARRPDEHAAARLEGRSDIWSYLTPELVVYRYAPNRSGSVPKQVLGDSQGRPVVDMYTGYNAVTKPGGRLRAGCIAHARRKLFEQREHPETKEALDLISEIYRVEREAKEAGIVGTDAHLESRISVSWTASWALLRSCQITMLLRLR
jgi:hypothetical protein